MAASEKDYVLGTHDAEIDRLALQHRVWRRHALEGWRAAGFTVGQTLLDLGSGPGNVSFDLAEIVGPTGKVLAMERSRRFLDHLEAMRDRRGLAQIETHELDLELDPLPLANADGAWCRWVFAFLQNPKALLAKVHRSLRPGATVVFHEYLDYRTWRYSPPSAELDGFVDVIVKAWKAGGIGPDVGFDLPCWMRDTGFEIVSLRPILEVAPNGSFTWEWPKAFVYSGAQRMVDLGELSQERADAIVRAFDERDANPNAFVVTPAVLEVVGRRL